MYVRELNNKTGSPMLPSFIYFCRGSNSENLQRKMRRLEDENQSLKTEVRASVQL